MINKKSLLFLLVTSILTASCFKKYIVTEKEIKVHYDSLSFKPDYKIVEGNRFSIFTANFGSDSLPLVLMLHGAPGRWEGFRKQLDDSTFHSKYHLMAPDRPGYGKSYYKRKYRKTNITKQAELLLEVLKLNKSESKPILIGRSYGAPVAAYMAYKNPEKFSKLILMSPAVNPAAEKFFWFSKYGKWPPIRWIIPKRMKTATDEKVDHVKELCDLEPIWDQIITPTVLMYGGRDWVVSKENFEYVKQRINPQYLKEVIFIPDGGHRISRSHADVLKRVINTNY